MGNSGLNDHCFGLKYFPQHLAHLLQCKSGLQLFHQRQRHHTCLDVSLQLHRNKWWTHRPSDLFACFFSWKKNVSEKKLLKRGPFWANLDLSERQAEVPNRSPLNSLPRLQPSWWPPRTVLCTVCKLSSFLLLPKIWVAECSWIYEHVVFQLPLWMIHNDPTGNFICHQEAVKGSGSSASIDAPFTAWPGSKVPAPDMTAWPSLKIIHLSQPLGEHPLWHLQWKCV